MVSDRRQPVVNLLDFRQLLAAVPHLEKDVTDDLFSQLLAAQDAVGVVVQSLRMTGHEVIEGLFIALLYEEQLLHLHRQL